MFLRFERLHRFTFQIVLALLLVAGCGDSTQTDQSQRPLAAGEKSQPTKPKTNNADLKDEIPPSQLEFVMAAHNEGLGAMERYKYREAAEAFRRLIDLAPGWIPGSINLSIALLNDTGSKAEDTKKRAGEPENANANFDEALSLLSAVIERDPENIRAHYCRGLILEYLGQGNTSEAHREFAFVTKKDPSDGHAWLKLGATLASDKDPSQPAGPEMAEKLIETYSRALECNPYLVSAMYKLQQAYGWARKGDQQKDLLKTWLQLNPKNNPAGAGDTAEAFYGESGKYAVVINPFRIVKPTENKSPAPKFSVAESLKVTLPEGERWVSDGDFNGPLALLGKVRKRFGLTITTFDANGDGRADLFLAAAVKGRKGVRDVLLLNNGDGSFTDVSKNWGLPEDRASIGVSAADFDADRRIDLFVTEMLGYHLLQNQNGQKFEDVTKKAGIEDPHRLALTSRWLDLDQDGDLDLYVLNATDLAHAGDLFSGKETPKVENSVFRNIGKPGAIKGRPEDNWAPVAVAPTDLPATAGLSLNFAAWPDSSPNLVGPPGCYTAIGALDIDDDRDLDLILSADNAPPLAILNDRLGKFHSLELKELAPKSLTSGLLVADFDKDGVSDIAFTLPEGRLSAWRNATFTSKSKRQIAWEDWPAESKNWRNAVATDFNLDTWTDLVGVSIDEIPTVAWSRNDGHRLEAQTVQLGPFQSEIKAFSGFTIVDVVGDSLPDLLILADGQAPLVARNQGNGNHWLAIELGGRWKTSHDHMRTNPHGIGTRIALQGQGLSVAYEHTTASTGLGQSLSPIVLGLGKSPSADLVRLRWPDGTMQCELNQKADTKLALSEFNRKSGSCPVLFTWNGNRFVCLGDFLGGGGLGYLIAPGVYSQPDRDESVAISSDQLRQADGVFRLSITEPMDEVAYLDQLNLVVVDSPPGVTSTPDERFAPEGPRPTGEILSWKSTTEPVRASDLKGVNILEKLRTWDRNTVDNFKRLDGWIGYAEEHGMVLDFGDRLKNFGPKDPLILVLSGWVEYPYSQTNYAAATAGVTLHPPAIERRNPDGTWTLIEQNAGYPAGLPRRTTLDLTGKLNGPECVIRIKTNMECYWDQAFLALRDKAAERANVQSILPVARAVLSHRGYTREVSPDGRQPLLYDYDYVDPAPLALMAGRLTRHGDVKPLLTADDDQLCLVAPGDEVRLEFEAGSLPHLKPGWTRSYVLKATGYCKDADPFTATSDQVEPLPWRGMPAFPFERPAQRPSDPEYRDYLERYQTRPAGTR